jgi:hypothetical protein
MKVHKIDMGETGLFSPLFLDFLNQKESLQSYYSLFPNKGNFKEQIDLKKSEYTPESRSILHDGLTRQYEGFEVTENVRQNIQLLQETNSYTIVTGHQLNIYGTTLFHL